VASILASCAPPPSPRDVLVITLDTARADRVVVQEGAPITPRIDAVAAHGAAFRNAISPVPLTLPAHASLFTGKLPPSHTVRDNGTYRLPADETTLAEILGGRGFATAAFVGAQVLDSRYGLDQGFGTYDDAIPDPGDSPFRAYAERPGDQVVTAAERWLERQGEAPVFVWVHLFEPHAPYRPPEPERSRFTSPYDGEIAFADRLVGRLLDHWERVRGLDRTLVVITSDHGEGLGEHDEPTHGVLVHEATLRVPLVVAGPGVRRGVAPPQPVSLVDVMPTLLATLGVGAPAGVEGRDLRPLLSGGDLAWTPEAGYAESLYAMLHHGCAPLRALRQERFKLVSGTANELFDLVADPGETRDLAGGESGRADALAETLDELVRTTERAAPGRLPLDEATRAALASLGYLGSGPAHAGGGRRDPRQALRSLRAMADADRSLLRGEPEAAVSGYRKVLADEPESVDARFRLAQILRSLRRGEEALGLLAEALSLNPEEPFLHQSLGDTLFDLGRHAESLATYDAGLLRHPGSRPLRDGRWRALNQLERHRIVLDEAERAVALDPSDAVARYARALACCGQGALAPYVAALERELRELPGDPVLERALRQARAEPRQ
jgi:arylsulfatase A-like enzyme